MQNSPGSIKVYAFNVDSFKFRAQLTVKTQLRLTFQNTYVQNAIVIFLKKWKLILRMANLNAFLLLLGWLPSWPDIPPFFHMLLISFQQQHKAALSKNLEELLE